MTSGKFGFSERLAIAGIVAGFFGTVAAMALPLAYPDMAVWVWRLIFWPSLGLTAAAIIFLVGDLIFLTIRHNETETSSSSRPRIRAIVGILLLFAMFAAGGWYVTTIPTPPPKQPQSFDGANLQSRAAKYIFSCPVPPDTDKRSREEILAEIKAIALARGETFGVSIEIFEIPQGIQLEITPKTQEAVIRMAGVSKVVFEIRRAGAELLVVALMELPEPLGLVGRLMPIDPASEPSMKWKNMVERMVGAPKGKCAIL